MRTCKDCIWSSDCCCDEVCGDFTPLDGSIEEAEYINDLEERHTVYTDMINELNDMED